VSCASYSVVTNLVVRPPVPVASSDLPVKLLTGPVLTVSDLDGRETYLEPEFRVTGFGLIEFDAVAQADLRVTFSTVRKDLKRTSVPCYNFCVGAFTNTRTFIRRANNSRMPKLIESQFERCMVDADVRQHYWFSVNADSGMIMWGKGYPATNKVDARPLMSWADPEYVCCAPCPVRLPLCWRLFSQRAGPR
jgi:hypothetical protein